jgi:endonuclease/exonuclease/phosphatase family metal-dependent hydrolase
VVLKDLRIATLNVSGGEKSFEEYPSATQKSRQEALILLLNRINAQVLCFQEASEFIDADGLRHSLVEQIRQTADYGYAFFGETLSMRDHMQIKKDIMVQGVFNDWQNWAKGNAILSKIPFSRLSDPNRQGTPYSIPLFKPLRYEGNRDTDPRHVILTRLQEPPYPFLATLHLTTLIGERSPNTLPGKGNQARGLRKEQIIRFLDLIKGYILQKNETLILTGDFNATAEEDCISQLLEDEVGFVHLIPENESPSHPKVTQPIDHIFFFPKERLVDYSCQIEVDDLSRRASDHLPVVADLKIQ